jgi:opacity protein-like surface antigen
MRRLLVVVALIGFASDARGGDFEMPAPATTPVYAPTPFVPAPPTYMRWSGFYGGAQAGYGSAHVDFSGTTESLIAYMLRELALESEQHVSTWKILGTKDTGGASGGGFVGYNSQWDDIILGVELMYSKTQFFAEAPSDPIARVTSAGGNTYDVSLSANGSMRINDFGTARVRAGYVMQSIMPWIMGGVAVGRVDYVRSATVDGIENYAVPLPCGSPPATNCTPFSLSRTEIKNNAWVYGWTAGAGVDVMVMPHVFLRAEYEYTSFFTLAGFKPAINTGRVGVGFKF